jgi:hypothetical protein
VNQQKTSLKEKAISETKKFGDRRIPSGCYSSCLKFIDLRSCEGRTQLPHLITGLVLPLPAREMTGGEKSLIRFRSP